MEPIFSIKKRGAELWFLIGHGEPYRREGCRNEGKTETVFYRPDNTDIVVYDTESGNLRMNVYAKWQKELYSKTIDLYLFDGKANFKEANRYTLEPLRSKKAAALECTEDGVVAIKLQHIEFLADENSDDRLSRSADDVFAAYERDAKNNPALGFPEHMPILKASFKVQFTMQKRPRTVVIQPPNRARYARDEDSHLIEIWLYEQEMIIPPPRPAHANVDKTLATA